MLILTRTCADEVSSEVGNIRLANSEVGRRRRSQGKTGTKEITRKKTQGTPTLSAGVRLAATQFLKQNSDVFRLKMNVQSKLYLPGILPYKQRLL